MLSGTTQMNLKGIVLANKSDKERQIMFGLTYMWDPNNNI